MFDWFKSKPSGPLRIAAAGSLSRERLVWAASECDAIFRAKYGVESMSQTVADTDSMLPTFDANAVLLVEPAPFAALALGDIVIWFTSSRQKIVHRIVARDLRGGEQVFWTQGDNLPRRDPEPVTARNFFRRVHGILYAAR